MPISEGQPPPSNWRGWRLMFLIMWDAVFHNGSDPHMKRAMKLSSEEYGKWDQDNTPSYPHKREDQL